MISKAMHPQRSQDSRPSLLRSLAAWHQLNSQQSEFLLLPGVIAVEVLKRPPEHQISLISRACGHRTYGKQGTTLSAIGRTSQDRLHNGVMIGALASLG